MITGAGILIVELYKGVPVVVLFGMNKMNFSDAGGSLHMGETPEMGACRECREESGNLLNIKPHELNQIGIPIQYGQYMSYIIYVQNLKAVDYVTNMNQTFNYCHDNSWKETNTIARIGMYDIINASNKNVNIVNDIYGGVCQIRGRTMGLIKFCSNILSGVPNYTPIMLHRNYVNHSRMPCLIGTHSYTISNNLNLNVNINYHDQNISYAIYIIPKDSTFLNCRKDTITHITLSGFTTKFTFHQLNTILIALTNKMSNKKWKIDTKTIEISDKVIHFKSNTLNKIAKFLYKNGVKKIKGPKYDGNEWHIYLDCKIPVNTIKKLEKMKWYVCVVSKSMDQIKTYDKYKVKEFS
jgi:hypothetical protein